VQQPCSNPSRKHKNTAENPLRHKTPNLAPIRVIFETLEGMRKGVADFTWQRSLVRSQHRPPEKSVCLQVKRQEDEGVGEYSGPCAATHYFRVSPACALSSAVPLCSPSPSSYLQNFLRSSASRSFVYYQPNCTAPKYGVVSGSSTTCMLRSGYLARCSSASRTIRLPAAVTKVMRCRL